MYWGLEGHLSDLPYIPRHVPHWITLTEIDFFTLSSPNKQKRATEAQGTPFSSHDSPKILNLAAKCYSTNQSAGPIEPLNTI